MGAKPVVWGLDMAEADGIVERGRNVGGGGVRHSGAAFETGMGEDDPHPLPLSQCWERGELGSIGEPFAFASSLVPQTIRERISPMTAATTR